MTTIAVPSTASPTGFAAEFAAGLLDPAEPAPPSLRTWNGSDPAQRHAVHRNNVTVSLVDALAEMFPVVQALVGGDFFRAMATLHVRSHPPTCPVLAHFGHGLADWIAGFAPAAGLPYLPDMVRLEALRVRAAHAADAAPLAGLDAAALAALQDPARAPLLRLGLHPSLGVLRSAHAVVALWQAHQQDEGGGADPTADPKLDQDAATTPAPWPDDLDRPEAALVLRPAFDVLVVPVTPAQSIFTQALHAGQPLGEAADAALAEAPDLDLIQTLALLLQQGAVVAIHHPEEGMPCP